MHVSLAALVEACCTLSAGAGRAQAALGSSVRSPSSYFRTYLELSFWLTTAVLVGGCQVLPEQSVVDVSAAVEVEEGRDAGGLGRVALGLSLAKGLEGAVEAVDIGLVVLGVVQLHDLARDVRLECAVVVCRGQVHVSMPLPRLLSKSSREAQGSGRASSLTGQVGESGLAADELGAGHAHDRLCSLSSQGTAQGGSRSEEGGRHFAGGCVWR